MEESETTQEVLSEDETTPVQQTETAEESVETDEAKQSVPTEETPCTARIKTTLSVPLMLQFNRSQSVKAVWLPLLLGVLLAGLGTIYIVGGDNLFSGVFVIVMGVLLPGLFFLVSEVFMRKSIGNSPVLRSATVQEFTFGEEGVLLHEESRVVTASDTELKYGAFFKVEEKRTVYYLFIGKHQAYIADKSGFVAGNVEALNELLRQKLGARFKPQRGSK